MSLLGFSVSGNRVNINTAKTTLDVSLSSGTTDRVDVLIHGYEYMVTGSSVHIMPLTETNFLFGEQVPVPFENCHTMKDVSSTLYPTLLTSITNISSEIIPWLFDFGHIFMMNVNDGYLYRISTIDGSQTQIDIGTSPSANYDSTNMTFGKNYNEVYISYIENADSQLKLSKIDFCDESETVVYSHDGSFNIDGDLFYITDVLYTCKVEYGNKEYVVLGISVSPDAVDGWQVFFVVYNITDGTYYESNYLKLEDTYTLDFFGGYHTSPKIIDAKVICTLGPDDWDGTPPGSLPTICVFPTYIVDCENSTVTRVNDYTIDTATVWPLVLWGSGIDHTNGYYYFWLEDINVSGDGALMRINLSTETTIQVTTQANQVYILQGDSNCYGLEGSASAKPVKTIPALATRGTLTDPYKTRVVDQKNLEIWTYNDTVSPKIESATVDFGLPKSLSIFGWGSTPFSYSLGRDVTIFVLAGTVIAVVNSFQFAPTVQQTDIYILRENIVCS